MIPAQDSQKCYLIQHRSMNLNLFPRGVKVYNKIDFESLSLKKIVNRYLGLFHNRSDCHFRNIPRMIWDFGDIFSLDDATIHDYLLLVCKTGIQVFSVS